jgi:hypothetical protein
MRTLETGYFDLTECHRKWFTRLTVPGFPENTDTLQGKQQLASSGHFKDLPRVAE